jgi:hypothetical protein
VPIVKFLRDGCGHHAGDVVEKSADVALMLREQGYAVDVAETPRVERAVAQEPEKRFAKLER